MHVVPWHFSPVVHASLSSHAAPVFGSTLQPVAGSHEFLVHSLVSEQSITGPAVHRPFWQVSFSVHLLLSVHGVLFATFEWLHNCVVGSHVSVVQGLLSSQLRPMPPHLPAVQWSPVVHMLPSSHMALSGLFGFWQPIARSQLSVVQSLLSLQLVIGPGRQVPLWQASPWVQTSLSVQGVLLAAGSCAQVPMLHPSVVHTLPSSVQGAPAGLKPFTGHVVAPPHVSATSHSPFGMRQTVLAAAASV
jgi:hypothetical protein